MKHKLTYLTALTLLVASCTSDDIGSEKGNTLSGDGKKTPIAIQTNLSATAPVTRAVDKTFEKNDVLLAYIEAGVTTDGTFSSADNPFKGLKTLKLTEDANNEAGDNHKDLYGYQTLPDGLHITETDKLEQDGTAKYLYWDDYSSTTNDLRADGAGIRLKYGYCYNGGTPSTALDQTAGTLGWTIGDQTTATAFKNADLLFAKTQAPVSYSHGTAESSNHGILVLPYSHAMSKITVVVTANEGFTEKANFASSVLILKHMQTKSNVNAPAGTVTASTVTDDVKDITTWKSATENKTATFQAIVAPGTNLSVGNFIATISNVDGNDYEVPITNTMLGDWASKLTETVKVSYGDVAQAKPRTRATIDGEKGYLTQSGVHYVLNVTIDKQKITVRATLADWDKVTASATGQIVFNPDVAGKGTIATALQADGFDVYKSSSNSGFSTKSTTLTYADSKWSYSPIIYWAGQGDNSYFRAVSPKGRDNETLNQGVDLLWGTSDANGNSGTAEESIITPRTGDVKLNFEHLMSKLCINLETVTGDAAVNLEGATIAISNMATTATYSIVNGTVTADDVAAIMLSGQPSGFTETVIPQTIGNDAKVTITLADGTTYSLQLNQCKLTTGDKNAVTTWEKGKSYTYTITLTKQEITFSAVVKDWVDATASGNATLDWD